MKNLDSIDPKSSGPIVHTTRLDSPSLSLLSRNPKPQRTKRFLKIFLGVIIMSIIIFGGIVIARAVNLSNKIFVGRQTSFFQKVKEVFQGGNGRIKLIGEDLGQINVLLLGIGGEGHDGPYLSDTIILAQIRPDIGQIVLTSIPRDYLVELPNNLGYRKINASFAEGYYRNKDWNEGGSWARQSVEKISGLTIPYFAVVDFAGFEKAIDQVGGITIEVERTFTDYTFPNNSGGYLAPLTFKAGQETMKGERALQFARSRHAAGQEGSDFARSVRQQKVIQAFKEKVIGLNLVSDSGKINNLLGTFANHFHTNISPGEIFRVYSLVKEKNMSKFLSLSLDPATRLTCPKIMEDTGAYVLVPCQGKTEQDIKNYFKNAFAIGKLYQEQSVIWLSSSTQNKTAYQQADKLLKDNGLTVWELPYKGEPFPQNIFYQVNQKPATAEFIKNSLNATEVTLPPPGFKIDASKVDVIVILGEK